MKHIYLLLSTVFIFSINQKASAQTLPLHAAKNIVKCYTVEVINEYRKTHPNAETDAHFEDWLGKKIRERKAQRVQSANYVIPIVFHIISKGEDVGTSPNISAFNISEQILQLNKDYANQSNSPYAVAANTGIQFVLAATDTLGATLAEPGIDRINISDKGWQDYDASEWTSGYIDQTVKANSIWDANRYYNVWIIPAFNNGSSELLGYATFPVSSTLPGLGSGETNRTAGVVVTTGTIGSAFAPFSCGIGYGLGKTLSHETGHFFGLRHIWGDAICGNDYCDDTPVQYTSNTGVPSHPKPNSCGTPDEMFENYMDYSDDIVLNTFTADQVDRMQTVMVNSPRRITLATSTVGNVPVTASNNISFEDCSGTYNTSETGTTGTYPRYKDVNITLDVEDKATGPATVTINAAGTAINNFHYQLLTPTVTFAAGDNFKNIKLRIFDNAEVDGNKTIVLSYAISGSGVTAGTNTQSLTVNISDNDNVKIGNNPVTIFSEDFGTAGQGLTGWLSGSFSQPAGINAWVLGTHGGAGVTGQALYISDNKTLRPLAYNVDSASDAVAVTPSISTLGYTNATLSFNYKCNGEADAQGQYDYGRLMYTYDNNNFYPFGAGNAFTYQGDSVLTNTGNLLLPPPMNDTTFRIGFRWINDDNTGRNPPFLIDDIKLNATPDSIETAVSTTYAFDTRQNTVNNFRSNANNKIMAVLSNASEDISAVTVQITQAGTGVMPINTSTGSFFRTQKVFQISPAAANATATYNATFYFNIAELAVWGADTLNLKILKVKDGTDLNGLLNSSNSELITPVATENYAGGYISYTGNFTGFSQFVLVSPATILPVTLIDFTAIANKKTILLSWSTALEINNKGFALERSTDGINFKQIGYVFGKGTTSLTQDYNFTDNFVQPNVVYYYRLRQVNYDGRETLSPIRNARIGSDAGIEIALSPNPARDYINIFIRGTANKATIQLMNAAGQKLKQVNNVNAYDGVYNLSLPAMAKGAYNIVIVLPEGTYTKKMIVE